MKNWYLRINAAEEEPLANINGKPSFTYKEVLQNWLAQTQEMRASMGKLEGYAYQGMDDFLMKHGAYYESQPLTPEEMKVIKQYVGSGLQFKQQQCFYNSGQLATTAIGTFQYVEGYVIGKRIPFPIHHAWNAINGKVIDTTIKHLNGGKPIVGVFQDLVYFGAPFSHKTITRIWCNTGMAYALLDFPVNEELFKRPYDAKADEHLSDEFYTNQYKLMQKRRRSKSTKDV